MNMPPNCIGRWAIVYVPVRGGVLLVGTVIDFVAGEPEKPKRIRIQRGNMQGQVLGLGEYTFQCFVQPTQIDP